jgi:hypothetical protein
VLSPRVSNIRKKKIDQKADPGRTDVTSRKVGTTKCVPSLICKKGKGKS